MPCSLVKVSCRFGGTYCILLQGRRVSQARNQHEAGRLTFIGLHGVLYHDVLIGHIGCVSDLGIAVSKFCFHRHVDYTYLQTLKLLGLIRFSIVQLIFTIFFCVKAVLDFQTYKFFAVITIFIYYKFLFKNKLKLLCYVQEK
jgi:hypothetical protein